MKTLKIITLAVLILLSGCLVANTAIASDQIFLITKKSTGQKIKADLMVYYPKQRVWGSYAGEVDKETKFKADDVQVRTQSGVLLYLNEEGNLCISAREEANPIQLSMSDGMWHVSSVANKDNGGPLAKVFFRNFKDGSYNTFEVPYHMWYSMNDNIWNFDSEDDEIGTRHLASSTVNIYTSVGEILVNDQKIWFVLPDNDWRSTKYSIRIIPGLEGSFDISYDTIENPKDYID